MHGTGASEPQTTVQPVSTVTERLRELLSTIFPLLSPAQVPPDWCTSVQNRAPLRPCPCSRSYTCSVERSETSSKDPSLNNTPTSFTLEEKTKGSPLSGVWIAYVDEAVVFLWGRLCPVQPCSGGTRTLSPLVYIPVLTVRYAEEQRAGCRAHQSAAREQHRHCRAHQSAVQEQHRR